MAKPLARIAVMQFGFALGVLAILARAAQLQLLQGERWSDQAQRQRTERKVLPSRRGAICGYLCRRSRATSELGSAGSITMGRSQPSRCSRCDGSTACISPVIFTASIPRGRSLAPLSADSRLIAPPARRVSSSHSTQF
jgi:hypothetical protein